MSGAELLRRAAVLLRAEVVRRDYSAGAWRVEVDGRTLSHRAPYPGRVENYAMPDIDAPLCADTKRGAEDLLARLRAETAAQLNEQADLLDIIHRRTQVSP